MAIFLHLDKAELQHLVSAFGLGPIQHFQPLTEGTENSNYRLNIGMTANGATDYLLAILGDRVKYDDLAWFDGILTALKQKDFPCSPYLRTPEGDLTSSWQNRPVVMSPFIPGHVVLTPTPEQAAQAGAALARLHTLSTAIAEASPRPNLFGYDFILQCLATAHKATLTPAQTQMVETLDHTLSHIDEARRHAWEWLPRTVIHADYFPDNVIFGADGNLSGVIDFYFSCTGPAAYDLAIALVAWGMDDKGQPDQAIGRALLDGYTSQRPLSKQETTAMPMLMQLACCRFLATRLHDQLQASAEDRPARDPMAFYWRLQHCNSNHGLSGLEA